MNKIIFSLIGAAIGWFAIIAQFVLMMENQVASNTETIIRFFSFFTILTNLLVAVYFTVQAFSKSSNFQHPGTLTAISVYITVVGLVYQVLLRHLWQPEGLQRLVDELLHSVIPVLVLGYWYFYESKSNLRYGQIGNWLLYPLVYLVYILIRGHFSDFYPYPFIHVGQLGLQQVLINAALLILFFTALSGLFIWMGKRVTK